MKKKFNPNRKKSGKPITGQDWLELKPYDRNTSYDYAWVEIANQLYFELADYNQMLHSILPNDKAPLKEICLLFSSYFEDVINEIGIWDAFVQRNHALFGYYLPFGTTEDYEVGQLNFEDLRYLCWHYFNQSKKSHFIPDAETLKLLASQAYELFINLWEDAPLTDFYEDWLTFGEDVPFFEVVYRLEWLSIDSYLLQFEFGAKLSENLHKHYSSPKQEFRLAPEFAVKLYSQDFIFNKQSSYAAMTATEWLSRICRASEEVKAAIAAMQYRFTHAMTYLRQDQRYYYFELPQLDRTIEVVRSSVDIAETTKPGSQMLLHLIPFRGEYWFSGLLMDWGIPKAPLQGPMIAFPFYEYDEEVQASLTETTHILQQDFHTFFGNFFVRSADQDDFIQQVKAFWLYHYQQQAKASNIAFDPRELDSMIKSTDELFRQNPDMSLVFVDQEGLLHQFGLNAIVALLEKPEVLTGEEQKKLIFEMAAELHPDMLEYVLAHYTPRKLCFPHPQTELDMWPYLRFFSRYMQPESYAPRFPKAMRV